MEKTKYNVSKDVAKRTCDGIVFDSVLEMRYYTEVIIPLNESGEIVYFELQKPYVLQPKFIHDGKTVQPITYVADFYLEYIDGHSEVIDIKGQPDSTARIKRKMFWFVYPQTVYRWITYSKIDGGFCDYDYVVAQRKLRKQKKKGNKVNEKK